MTSSTKQRRTRVVAVAVIAAMAATAVVGVSAVVVGSDDDDRVAQGADATTTQSPTLELGRTWSGVDALAGGLEVDGRLPGGGDTGVVIDPSGSRASADDVTELLAALGLDAEPERVDGGWTARGEVRGEPAAFALDESAGNVWQLATGPDSACLAVVPGGAPPDSTACSSSQAPSDEPGPGREALLDHARDLFELVGVEPGTGLQALEGPGTTTLDVPLTVEGLPVVGVTLSVTVDADGITGAVGWLRPRFDPLGAYPLVSARVALDRLQDAPVPEIGRCALPTDADGRPRTDGGCVEPEPAVVSDARLAWLPTRSEGRTLLVPAWQFEADGFFGPAAVAVLDDYLADPSTS